MSLPIRLLLVRPPCTPFAHTQYLTRDTDIISFYSPVLPLFKLTSLRNHLTYNSSHRHCPKLLTVKPSSGHRLAANKMPPGDTSVSGRIPESLLLRTHFFFSTVPSIIIHYSRETRSFYTTKPTHNPIPIK